jgi:hypothetical protein
MKMKTVFMRDNHEIEVFFKKKRPSVHRHPQHFPQGSLGTEIPYAILKEIPRQSATQASRQPPTSVAIQMYR